MAIDTGAVDRALGAIGTTFRLTRLYPPSHPAVLEAMRHITASLPALAGLGSVEWKVGATGLIWHGQHLLPRNTQVAELAGLLFARGIRAIQVNPGVTAEHWLGLFGVAVGNVAPDDAVLGRITVHLGRRATQRLTAARALDEAPPAPAAAVPPPVIAPASPSAAASPPPDVAEAPAAPPLPPPPGPGPVAWSPTATVNPSRASGVFRPDVLPAERAHLVHAVGALGAVSGGLVVDAYLHAAAERREAYRAAMRAAGERTIELLQSRIESKVPEVVAAAAEFLGLTGSPQVAQSLITLTHHGDERVREAALLGLAELGGREISRPAMPALKDESVLVRSAAARAVAAAGDVGATTVLARRLEQEKDEGVLAALLKAIGQLGAKEALEILAKFAEPGGKPRRTPFVRAAAIEGLARLDRVEAKALLELYARDKEPTVKRAAEASLR